MERQKRYFADPGGERAGSESLIAATLGLLDEIASSLGALEGAGGELAAAASEGLADLRERRAALSGPADQAVLALRIRLWIRDTPGLEAFVEEVLPGRLLGETEFRFRLVESLIRDPEAALRS